MRSSSCPAKFTSSESTPFKATSASSIETQLSYAHQESTVNLIQLLQAGNAMEGGAVAEFVQFGDGAKDSRTAS